MNWKHILAGLFGFVIGFYVCMPREVMLQDRWEVLVSDLAGHGLAGATVRQVRRDFATGRGESSSLQFADSYGRAAFFAVHARSSPLLRGVACVRRMVAQGISAPCGYSQQITAAEDGYSEAARTEQDLPLRDRGRLLRITMRPAH